MEDKEYDTAWAFAIEASPEYPSEKIKSYYSRCIIF